MTPQRTWIKICANTNFEDARFAAHAGADCVGFVFSESKRQVKAAQAAEIAQQLPAGIQRSGIFNNAPIEEVVETAKQVGLNMVQLHGEETYIDELRARLPGVEVMKTLKWNGTGFPALVGEPSLVLLDAGAGSGKTFDWEAAAGFATELGKKYRVVVAGGLSPQNVSDALRVLRPWGVDVVSGVEASYGKKDHAKVRAFIEAVRSFRAE
jgi:phosphoribosylanthranilate isomerase